MGIGTYLKMTFFLDFVKYSWHFLAIFGIINFLYLRFVTKEQKDNQPLQSYLAYGIYFVLGVFFLNFIWNVAEPLRPWTAVVDADNIFVKCALIIFLNELIIFVAHWMGHAIEFFWCEHIVHHTSRDFSTHTVFRQAPGLLIWIIPVYINFFVADRITAFACHGVMTFHSIWTHSDTKYEFNKISKFIHTPGTHRVHHDLRGRAEAKNIGAIFTIFDHLFGTYEAPKEGIERQSMQMGVKGYTGNEWILRLFFMPYIKYFKKLISNKSKVSVSEK